MAQPPITCARPTAQTAGLGLATALACLSLGGVAEAQTQAPPTGSRYLSWANRTTSTTPPRMAANAARADILPRRVAPSQGLARPQMQPFNPPIPITEGGLTPASAWIGPRVAPSFAPGNPDPLAYATTELAAAPPPPPVMTTPARTAPVAPPPPRVEAPVPAPVAQPVYTASASAPAAAPTTASAADPMAPRPDAPIFRLRSQGAAPAPTQTAQPQSAPAEQAPAQPAPVQQAPIQQAPAQTSATGQAPARYYSVHRAAGRQPDPTVMPDPVFFDSVAMDLAAPPEMEPPRRDAQGRLIPVANADPSLP
ncbi:hypothetical protein [Brevundimonas sp. AAP58]|uniref:hypothetical protein n=1 Tax=Brevundimonas sp. AAP58 TaxID=1523422 RepID=UPI0012E2C561|nr:hypothetical protein [Brevundimonas sp. AAP58]